MEKIGLTAYLFSLDCSAFAGLSTATGMMNADSKDVTNSVAKTAVIVAFLNSRYSTSPGALLSFIMCLSSKVV